MTIGFQMRGDNPVGTWEGKVLPATGVRECTAADKATFLAEGPFFKGTQTFRWTFIAGVLTALTDDRPVGTWNHTPGPGVQDGDGNWVFELEVGDVEPTVTLTLTVKVTRTDLVELKPSGHKVKLALVTGDASLLIATDKPTEWEVSRVEKYALSNKLIVRVRSTKLYAV